MIHIIAQSEHTNIIALKENHAMVFNAHGTLIAIINRSKQEIIWQQGIQAEAQALFTESIKTLTIDTTWTTAEFSDRYAEIEVNPLIKNYSSLNNLHT